MDREPQEEPRAAVRVESNHDPCPADRRILGNTARREQCLDGLLRVVGLDRRQLQHRRQGLGVIGREVNVVAGLRTIVSDDAGAMRFSVQPRAGISAPDRGIT